MAIRGKKKPLSERERRIWRSGLLAGSVLSIDFACATLEEAARELRRFSERVKLRGVAAEPPKSFSIVHPMAKWRRRS